MEVQLSAASKAFPCPLDDTKLYSFFLSIDIRALGGDAAVARDTSDVVVPGAVVIDMSITGALAGAVAGDARQTNEDLRVYHRCERIYRRGGADKAAAPPPVPVLSRSGPRQGKSSASVADVIGAVARLEDGERPIVVFVDYDFLVAARPCTRSSCAECSAWAISSWSGRCTSQCRRTP